MALEELLRGLWRQRGGILLSCLVLYVLAVSLVWNWPRSYVATAIVAPSETTGIATSSLLTPSPFLQPSLLDQRPGGNFAVYLAALRAPDHAGLVPFRFAAIRGGARGQLADLFEQAALLAGKGADEAARDRGRALDAPLLVAVI
eukprot:gene14605-17845_t